MQLAPQVTRQCQEAPRLKVLMTHRTANLSHKSRYSVSEDTYCTNQVGELKGFPAALLWLSGILINNGDREAAAGE